MTKINELLRLKIFLLISFLFVVISNTYFSYEQSIIYGARDGVDYFLIAQNFPNVPIDVLEYHKAWRFIIPSLIGFLGKIFNLDVYLIFRAFVFIFCIIIILIFLEILKSLKFNSFHIYFLSSFIIFNPYLFRFFIALPTMINDLIFICATLLLILGFIKNRKFFFYLGILLSVFTRQNSIFLLLSIIIIKLIYKKKSIFKIKDIFILTVIFAFFYLLNNYYANTYTVYNDAYSIENRLGLFTIKYSLDAFLKYNFFPMIIILPLLGYLAIENRKFDLMQLNSEFFVFIVLLALFIISVGYLGGPIISGKNIIRLINLGYPLLILIGASSINFKNYKFDSLRFYFYNILFILWSFHPTFSKVKIFDNIRFLFINL